MKTIYLKAEVINGRTEFKLALPNEAGEHDLLNIVYNNGYIGLDTGNLDWTLRKKYHFEQWDATSIISQIRYGVICSNNITENKIIPLADIK